MRASLKRKHDTGAQGTNGDAVIATKRQMSLMWYVWRVKRRNEVVSETENVQHKWRKDWMQDFPTKNEMLRQKSSKTKEINPVTDHTGIGV
jgi:hypothetical protein